MNVEKYFFLEFINLYNYVFELNCLNIMSHIA